MNQKNFTDNMTITPNSLSNNKIKFIPYSDFLLWDVKRYTNERIKSKFPIVRLGEYINEENHKVKLNESPEEEFGILGVNNKIGIFDAYKEKGKDINQSYKKMEIDWLAYNPYRINVGSIGLRTSKQSNEFISPAYVVFSCKEDLLPDFLYKLFKTNRFNKIVKVNTTGSVRQNLTIEILKNLNIPLPKVKVQKEILNEYYDRIKTVRKNERRIIELQQKIENIILTELGLILPPTKIIKRNLLFYKFSNLDRWDVLSNDARIHHFLLNAKFPLKSLGSLYTFISRNWKKPKNINENFKYIEIGAIDPILGIVDINNLMVKDAPSRANQIIKTGDLIIGTTRPYLKKFAIVGEEFNDFVCSSGFSVIENSKEYNLIFLKEFLLSFYGIEQLKNRMSGGTYPAITSSELKEVKIPLPPIKTQNLIVNTILKIRTEMITLVNSIESDQQIAIRKFENEIFLK
ncbi:MAG: restriction endonuclease subunit S [Ignavibacteria bacterium]